MYEIYNHYDENQLLGLTLELYNTIDKAKIKLEETLYEYYYNNHIVGSEHVHIQDVKLDGMYVCNIVNKILRIHSDNYNKILENDYSYEEIMLMNQYNEIL